jgi:hypothetical protein
MNAESYLTERFLINNLYALCTYLSSSRNEFDVIVEYYEPGYELVSYAYLLSGLSPHVRYAYFGQEFLSSKLANHSFTHENCGA